MPEPDKPKRQVYKAWTICVCNYIGDSWWLREGTYYEYFCEGCKKTFKNVEVDEDIHTMYND